MEEVRQREYERADEETAARGGALGALLAAARPRQWVKNLLVLAPLVFSRHLFEREAILDSLAVFACFCLVSSAGYLINDVHDLENDRRHPLKRRRPLASGRLGAGVALTTAAALLTTGLTGAFLVNQRAALVVGAYALVSLAYTFLLKRLVIVDVFAVAAGFVLRATAGALAIQVFLSNWLLVCTTMLALLVGFGKRRNELLLLKTDAGHHRRVLDEYNLRFLDMLIGVSAAATMMSYALYTASEETVERFHTRAMLLTLPFVLYGVFRYIYLIYFRERGGDPVETALSDTATLVNLALWTATVVVVLYFR